MQVWDSGGVLVLHDDVSYWDTCVVAPHLGCLNEVVWMRAHNLCLSGRC